MSARPYLTRAEFTRLKGRLTRAVNKAKAEPNEVELWRAVEAERDYAFAIFDEYVWPDDWARWERAADDAHWTARRLA